MGNLFENFVLNEIIKKYYNQGKRPNIFFWKDSSGSEIDCLIEHSEKILAIEIKSSRTFNYSFLDNLKSYQSLENTKKVIPALIYGGEDVIPRQSVKIYNWKDSSKIISDLYQ